jgi:hypothetical protein
VNIERERELSPQLREFVLLLQFIERLEPFGDPPLDVLPAV